jgi:hypothetical protein
VCRCIHQPKRHDEILIKPISHRESRLGEIFITDFNLMIVGVEINLGEHLGSRQLIKQDIDAWKRILILDGDYIQRSVIHTQAEIFIFLLIRTMPDRPKVMNLGK